MSSYFRFDVFFQLWERGPYARLNLFPEDSTRSRTNIWIHDIATRSRRHHRDIVWILDDVIEQRTELYTRFLAFWTFIDRFWKKYRMRINQFVCVIFDYSSLAINNAFKFMKFINFKGDVSLSREHFSLGHHRYSYSLRYALSRRIHDQWRARRSEETAQG